MAFAQPVVRDQFLYNGDLFVDVGNANRHKRASVAEIIEVLRPDLKKPKNATAVKDPVGHWYEAQLVHYGLQPSKDKARAKMRLLENLNQSNLKIPAHIKAIESDLKKEFTAAERKAKAQYKADLAATQSAQKEAPAAKKRKISANRNPTTTINVNVSMGGPASPFPQSPSPPKKRKVQTARRGGSTSVPSFELSHAVVQQNANAAESPKPRQKQTARRSASSSLSYRPNTTSSHGAPSTSAPHKIPAFEVADLNQHPSSQIDVQPKKEPKPKVKKAAKVKQEKPVPNVPNVQAEPNSGKISVASPSRTAGNASLGLINGIYEISCPSIENEWDYDGFSLTLTLDSPSLWAEYDFGMFTGILFIPQRPYSASPDTLPFQWRGREDSEHQMSFGDNCVGGISFLGNGYIEGWINLYGKARFEGMRMDGPGTAIRTASSMRDEWNGYNDAEYERERNGRWR
ncbi:MAG: hypothetical protein Q9169_007834 [Polycauliona sp. 2 TL-2023]